MHIEVTQQDIDNSRDAGCNWCPVELAIIRTLGRSPDASFYQDMICGRIFLEVGGEAFDLPGRVTGFIDDFDAEDFVQPFTFDLPIDHLVSAS